LDVVSIAALVTQGKFSEAIQMGSSLVADQQRPAEDRVHVCLLMAQSAARLGFHSDAGGYVRTALSLAPADSHWSRQALVCMGKVVLRSGDTYLAEQAFLEFLARYGDTDTFSCHAIFGLAQVYERGEKWETAASMYQRAAGVSREDGYKAAAYQNMAWCMMMGGKLGQVKKWLDKADKLIQGNAHMKHNNRAMTLYLNYVLGGPETIKDSITVEEVLVFRETAGAWATCLMLVTLGQSLLPFGYTDTLAVILEAARSLQEWAVVESGDHMIARLIDNLAEKIEGVRVGGGP
jgi:tetratricopeptide (TPR) repeat protein